MSAQTVASTLVAAFRTTVADHRDEAALRTLEPDDVWTWNEYDARARAGAAVLHGLGVGHGDAVGVMLTNRPAFHAADTAALLVGAVPFSLYNTSPVDDLAYVLADAGARVVITERAFADRVRDAAPSTVEDVLEVDGETPWDADPPDVDVDALGVDISRDDLATIIYTSGTTGPPKGVELTHHNVVWMVHALAERVGLEAGMEVLDYLPMAHIAERLNSHYLPIVLGTRATCCPDAAKAPAHLAVVRPHFFFAPPRLWEKLSAAVQASLGDASPADHGDAVRAKLGFDRLLCAYVGAAPVPPELVTFWRALGVPLGEEYGLSECTGVATAPPLQDTRPGTVGTAVSDVELRTAGDGEVLVRSPGVMAGYRGKPDLTAATIDADGWLSTGDIGSIDDDGYLTIVDRKKELIVNAAGKNMSPSAIEAKLKAGSPLIGQACAIGDGRPYVTALIVLDPDAAAPFAERHGIAARAIDALSRDEQVLDEVGRGVERANERMARVEQIKRFAIVAEDWQPGGDELTPTMKLKRKPVTTKYAETIASLYREE